MTMYTEKGRAIALYSFVFQNAHKIQHIIPSAPLRHHTSLSPPRSSQHIHSHSKSSFFTSFGLCRVASSLKEAVLSASLNTLHSISPSNSGMLSTHKGTELGLCQVPDQPTCETKSHHTWRSLVSSSLLRQPGSQIYHLTALHPEPSIPNLTFTAPSLCMISTRNQSNLKMYPQVPLLMGFSFLLLSIPCDQSSNVTPPGTASVSDTW